MKELDVIDVCKQVRNNWPLEWDIWIYLVCCVHPSDSFDNEIIFKSWEVYSLLRKSLDVYKSYHYNYNTLKTYISGGY